MIRPMHKPASPCYDCPDRHVGCHTICTEYNKYRYTLDSYNAYVRENKKADDVVFNSPRRVASRHSMWKKGQY